MKTPVPTIKMKMKYPMQRESWPLLRSGPYLRGPFPALQDQYRNGDGEGRTPEGGQHDAAGQKSSYESSAIHLYIRNNGTPAELAGSSAGCAKLARSPQRHAVRLKLKPTKAGKREMLVNRNGAGLRRPARVAAPPLRRRCYPNAGSGRGLGGRRVAGCG